METTTPPASPSTDQRFQQPDPFVTAHHTACFVQTAGSNSSLKQLQPRAAGRAHRMDARVPVACRS
eukprot:2971101-Rhodomonas_salina.5